MALPGSGGETIGNWTPDLLIRTIQELMENQPTTSLQSLKVDEMEVVRKLILRDSMSVASHRLQVIGKGGAPGFANSWVNYATTTAPAAFWKDAFGVIHLQGLIKSGTVGSAAFMLPPGFRPDYQHVFGVVSNGAIGRVDVFADGSVVPASPSSNVYVTLDGITLRPT